jgi:hypothetical protein
MHLDDHTRSVFDDWLAQESWGAPPDTPAARRILTSVWDCTDALTADCCHQLDLEPGTSYSRAAQLLMRDWKATEDGR